MKKPMLCCMVALSTLAAGATAPLWMRDIRISPDGSKIAFTYKGDIYTVPTTGGTATRLTTLPSYEQEPVWSPDGKSIAFASDRHGSHDVFIMPANGGTATRLTYNSGSEIPQAFSPDGKNVLYTGHIQDPASSIQFPTARMSELYAVPVNGGKSTLDNAAVVLLPSFSPDGSWMVYEDYKGMEDVWRKHHTSSATHDIWRYDSKTKKYDKIISHAGEDRNPVVSPDGKTIAFLSERDGKTMNIYTAPASNPSDIKQVTDFKTHPVRFLSQAKNGTYAFGYDGEIYTMGADNKPSKVNVDIVIDETPDIERIAVRPSGSAAISPDGKQIAFTSRGNVFVASSDYSSLKQITDTPEGESHVSWSPDGKTLIYESERDGHWNLYTATVPNESDPNFSNATVIEEKALFNPKDGIERNYAQYSPDGKSLAFMQDRTKIMIMDLATKKVRQLTDGSTVTRRTSGISFDWSPDSKWILTTVVDNHHDPYSDIAIINVADGNMINLTESGYTCGDPRWAFDGNAITYTTERYGMRSHASWGSQDDVMIVFLNRETFDKFNLNEEDYQLMKEAEKNAKKDTAASTDSKDKKAAPAKKEAAKDIVVEPEGLARRTVRLTPFSSSIGDYIVTKDGVKLYYTVQSNGDGKRDLWSIDLRKGTPTQVKRDMGFGGMEMDKDGKIYILGSRSQRLDPKTGKTTPITMNGTQLINHDAERNYMFDYVKVQEGKRFYNTNMHGIDWEKMTEDYRKFMPHINNNYDFAEMLSELLGELNVSHTGGRYTPPRNPNVEPTASLGLLFDMAYNGKGLKVDEVVAGGPFDKAASKVTPGCIIEKINETVLTPTTDDSEVLNGLAGQKTLITVYNPDNGQRWEETVKPISAAQMNNLMYDRWVASRAAEVDRLSNGRLGYVHIKSMNDDSFRPMYSDVLGKYNDREGIVIDIRHNGGGRLHEDLEVFFSGKKYLTQVVRGQETCDMPSRRWNKPSIMLQSEACYSNAHGSPWVYKTMGIGKLVGAPVPGTMTSVNWVTMQDPTMVFGIPVVGYLTAEGNYLENTQLEPDVLVLPNPGDVNSGDDKQLKAAVETLLKDIDAQKKK